MERTSCLAMILLGLAGAAYFAHRVSSGQSVGRDVRAAPVLRTGPVVEGPNGHAYQYVADPNVSWQHAREAAQALVWHGKHGYLATIDSQAEFNFIVSTAFSRQYPDV